MPALPVSNNTARMPDHLQTLSGSLTAGICKDGGELGSASGRRRGGFGGGRRAVLRRMLLPARQVNRHAGALVRRRLDGEKALMRVDDAEDDGQAEAGAAADVLGG